MSVLYVNFVTNVGPRTFGCVAMGSAVLIDLILCRVWSEQSAGRFVSI